MTTERELLFNLPLYSKCQLNIRSKAGEMIPLKFNKAQQYIHERLEKQKKETGMVRAVILKGRQQGCSTYIAARYYHQTIMNPGTMTFIFAHDREASESLYHMVKSYYEDCYDPDFRPPIGASNAKELLFPKIKSGYKVGTAGTKGLGRSKTFQQIHWSEVAFSPNTDEHAAGILQTVAESPGTEIILESTANGQGNYYYNSCMDAMAGLNGYEFIFVPWFWEEEYKVKVDKDFRLEQSAGSEGLTSEQEYYDIFKNKGLTIEHLAWRRKKIRNDFLGDVKQFMQEYPFTPEEAFISTGDPFISAMLIQRAINEPPVNNKEAPLIFGVDPARLGGDKFVVHHRKGRNSTKHERYPPMRLDQSAARLAQDIRKYKPYKVMIDCGGLGVGLYDMLIGMQMGDRVVKVDFGASSARPELNKNMTAEMFREAKEWLEDGPVSMALLDQKDATRIQSQLSSRRYDWDRNSVLRIESKETYKKEFNASPDDADAFLLTFAQPISPTIEGARTQQTYTASIPEFEW